MTDPIHTFCSSCGEVDTIDLSQALAKEKAMRDAVTEELAESRQTIKGLRGSLAERREANPKMEEARELFEYWRTTCGHEATRSFGDKRPELVISQLKNYSLEECKRAIRGYAAFPDVGKTGRCRRGEGKRFDKFEFIFRDEINVSKGLDLAERAEDEMAHTAALTAEADFLTHRREMDREPIDRLLRALTESGLAWGPATEPDRWLSTCPNEHDEPAPLFIDLTEAQTVALRCMDGCKGWEVALGLDLDLSLCCNHGTEWGRPARPVVTELRPVRQLDNAA